MKSKITIKDFLKKKGKEKIVMITAYDYPTAKLVDEAGVDGILVGDSVAMVVLGRKSTIYLELEELIHHLKAVVAANPRALIVADMPFGSYEVSIEDAVRNAIKLVKHGAEAVKLEGGKEIFNVVEKLVKIGIPVMGHIGLNPQRVLRLGGYKLMGKKSEQAIEIIDDAKALEEAGAFAIVIEHTIAEVAAEVTRRVKIPTICIGSGPYCDGQIAVLHDVIGLGETIPYFIKKYANIGITIRKAVEKYVEDVKQGLFPGPEHYRTMELKEKEEFEKLLRKRYG